MKINWGTAIVIAFIGFISFILYFVISMSVNKKYSYDLVTDGYYQQELEYQDQIDAAKNATDFEEKVKAIQKEDGIYVYFPKDIDYQKITGKVFLYRPSNKQLDFEMPILISKNYLLVPDKRLLDGRWNISIAWEYENKKYFHKQALNL